MKKFLLLFGLLPFLAISQIDCNNQVNTDWYSPENLNLPKDILNPLGDQRFLNGFNWFPKTPGGSYEDYDLTNMVWSGVTLLEMDNIWSLSIPYYNYLNQSQEPLPKNGWELLLVNIGRFPNDVDVNSSNETFQALPYIVIYNRYSGTIRVFVNFGLDNQVGSGPDAVEVTLEIMDNFGQKNGLLRLYGGYDKPLDQNTSVLSATAIAKATNAQRQWMSCDFQIAFDPCICYFPSKLQLSFNQISEESIYLYGRSLSSSDDIINPQLQVNPMTFLSGFETGEVNQTLLDSKGSGILVYKGLQTVVDDYIARIEQYKQDLAAVQLHNQYVEHNLNALKMLKYCLTAILTYGIGGNAIDLGAAQGESWFASMTSQYGDFIKTANGTFDIEKILGIAKKILGSSAKTYIEQNFEKLPNPNEPDKTKLPKVTYSEMKFTGTSKRTQVKAGPSFYTPGTYGSEGTKVNGNDPVIQTVYNYPIYNDALGLFALLETPKFEMKKRIIESSISKTHNQVYYSSTDMYEPGFDHSWTKEYQFKLKNELKYALNSTLDFKKSNIKVAIRFKGFRKYIFTNGKEFNAFINPDYTTNLFATNKDLNSYDKIRSYSNTPFTGNISDNFYAVTGNWCYNKVPLPNGGYSMQTYQCFRDDTVYFQSAFIPIDAFFNMTFGVGMVQEYPTIGVQPSDYLHEYTEGIDLQFMDFELIIMIDSEFETLNDKNLNNTSLQSFTYQIPLPQLTSVNVYDQNMFNNNLNVSSEITEYNENLEFTNIVFGGQPVKNCDLIGNKYTCRAWNNIEITGNISSASGYVVDMIAGNEINVVPSAIVSPEVNLMIFPTLDYSHPMPNVNNEYLTGYCKGTNPNLPSYKAKMGQKDMEISSDDSNVSGQDKLENYESLDLILFPNPTNNRITGKLNIDVSNSSCIIFDIYGKMIVCNFNSLDQNSFTIDMSNLSSGIYFVTINTDKGAITKQIIKK